MTERLAEYRIGVTVSTLIVILCWFVGASLILAAAGDWVDNAWADMGVLLGIVAALRTVGCWIRRSAQRQREMFELGQESVRLLKP